MHGAADSPHPELEPPAEHPSAVAHASFSAPRAARVQAAEGARVAGRSAAEGLDASEHGATLLRATADATTPPSTLVSTRLGAAR
jgi:hypothetical protein